MHHDQGALAPGQRQHLQHLVIAEAQALVGHVDLERGEAVADQRRQLLAQHLLGRIGDDEVVAVVDDGVRPRPLVILLHHLPQRLSAVLGREGDDGGGAAEDGRRGAAPEVVGAHQAA